MPTWIWYFLYKCSNVSKKSLWVLWLSSSLTSFICYWLVFCWCSVCSSSYCNLRRISFFKFNFCVDLYLTMQICFQFEQIKTTDMKLISRPITPFDKKWLIHLLWSIAWGQDTNLNFAEKSFHNFGKILVK